MPEMSQVLEKNYITALKYLTSIVEPQKENDNDGKKGKQKKERSFANSGEVMDEIIKCCFSILKKPDVLIARDGVVPYYEVYLGERSCFGVSQDPEKCCFITVNDIKLYQPNKNEIADLLAETGRYLAVNMAVQALMMGAESILGPKYVVAKPYSPDGLKQVCRDILKKRDEIKIVKDRRGVPNISVYLHVKNKSTGKKLFLISYPNYDKASYDMDVFDTKNSYNTHWSPYYVDNNYACFESEWPEFDSLLPELYREIYIAHCKQTGVDDMVFHGTLDKLHLRCDLNKCSFKGICEFYPNVVKRYQELLAQQVCNKK